MKKLAAHTSHLAHWQTLNPMVIFWLGVLTGALFVALAFLYKGASTDGGAALYRTSTSPSYSTYSAPSSSLYLPPPPSMY